MSDCNSPCSGNSTQNCGGADRMLAFNTSCSGIVPPSGHACLDPVSQALPFCNPSLSVEGIISTVVALLIIFVARVSDLIERLTQDEILGLLGPDSVDSSVDLCSCMTAGVPRLGIPSYMQIVETNSAVASSCYGPFQCATEFPYVLILVLCCVAVGCYVSSLHHRSPALLAASFNRTLWHTKGAMLSDEMRAFNNLRWFRGYDIPFTQIGLLGYGMCALLTLLALT